MTVSRLHVSADLKIDLELTLPEETGHYVSRVLRLAAGDQVIVFNARDGSFEAKLTHVQGAQARLHVTKPVETLSESPLDATLIQGLCRGTRMDYCVQKATELGVQRIQPLVTARCVVRLDDKRAAKRVAHWQGVARSACEQSGRTVVPVIDAPMTLAQLLSGSTLEGLAVLDADEGLPFNAWSLPASTLSLVIGPEGGLTPDEIAELVKHDAARWRMGPRVLRTETAGVVALALAQARWGDLG